jgi:hypothetical protein
VGSGSSVENDRRTFIDISWSCSYRRLSTIRCSLRPGHRRVSYLILESWLLGHRTVGTWCFSARVAFLPTYKVETIVIEMTRKLETKRLHLNVSPSHVDTWDQSISLSACTQEGVRGFSQ